MSTFLGQTFFSIRRQTDIETVYIIFDKETDGHEKCLHRETDGHKKCLHFSPNLGQNTDIWLLVYRLSWIVVSR